ncbi:unnamed protein product, partial [Larinioides sclopetarius]
TRDLASFINKRTPIRAQFKTYWYRWLNPQGLLKGSLQLQQ